MAYDKPYQTAPNTGSLFASKTKTNALQPDYWGEFKLDLKSVEIVDGVVTFKLSGWKKKGTSGTPYLSLAVNTWKGEGEKEQPKSQDLDDDIEF